MSSVENLQLSACRKFLNHNTGAISCAARREPVLTVTDDRHTDQATAKCVAIGGIACAQYLSVNDRSLLRHYLDQHA